MWEALKIQNQRVSRPRRDLSAKFKKVPSWLFRSLFFPSIERDITCVLSEIYLHNDTLWSRCGVYKLKLGELLCSKLGLLSFLARMWSHLWGLEKSSFNDRKLETFGPQLWLGEDHFWTWRKPSTRGWLRQKEKGESERERGAQFA